jgi:class 3 adenylate cyclase
VGSIPDLLAAWRAAERRWERHAPAEEVRAAALEVIAAWAAYQDAALLPDTREFIWGDTVNLASRMESLGVAGECRCHTRSWSG